MRYLWAFIAMLGATPATAAETIDLDLTFRLSVVETDFSCAPEIDDCEPDRYYDLTRNFQLFGLSDADFIVPYRFDLGLPTSEGQFQALIRREGSAFVGYNVSFLQYRFDGCEDGCSGFQAEGTGTLDVRQVNGVPEPSTWAMMVLGMLAIGMSLRARRRDYTSSAALA